MKNTSRAAVCLLLCLVFGVISYADFQILNPGYKVELWASLSASSGTTREMVFDHDGNLYFTTNWLQSVTKITRDKQVNTSWATGLNNPCGIEYTGGTSYGNNLYVSCINGNKVVKIDMNGNKSDFCNLTGVTSIAYDRTGQYSNKLYVGTSAYDTIYSLSATGSATSFCTDFYNFSGSIQGIGFANSAAYGYAMYAGTEYPYSSMKSGAFKVSTSGTAQRTCTNLENYVAGYRVEYDEMGLFGGNLFAGIAENGNAGIYRISSDGTAAPFITGNIDSFTFGYDGAMYLHNWTSQGASIYKITPIPEPATMLLLGLGLLELRRRK